MNKSNGIFILKSFKNAAWMLMLSLVFALPAHADYVGELETTKYFDPDTITLIKTRGNAGLKAGDEISYFIQFTPTDNGGNIGGGGFVTDYIPAGTQVVNAQFVRLNGDGTYMVVAPPTPAAVYPAFVPMYSDTGIFYSNDARTAMRANMPANTLLAAPALNATIPPNTTPANTTITPSNGYTLTTINPGCSGISLPTSTHNWWDSLMSTKYRLSTAPTQGGTCASVPAAMSSYLGTVGNVSSGFGLSPVAGPDTYMTVDYTGAVGPWQRIKYPGSMKGTANGVASITGCVGGVVTTAGSWDFATDGALPVTTNAIRFAAGKVTVGELFSARITLKLTADLPATALINNAEVFGGDISLDPGGVATGGGSHPSAWNQWRYHCPAVAMSNSKLMVLKNLAGWCIGTNCVPADVTAGVVPASANLKLRYKVQYLNTGNTAQSNVNLTDTFAAGGVYVKGSAVQLNGTSIVPPATATTLTFTPNFSLAVGEGGTVQYDVNVATAPADGTALINTATMTSTQVPTPGVTSKAIATVSTQANLWIGKTAASSTVASGGTATYTISIPNNGGTAVTATATKPITVNDFLPTGEVGTTRADRFSYVAGSVVANTWTATGVATPVTPTVTTVPAAPATATATAATREQVTFNFTTATIPIGGKLIISFNATVGSNVPAKATPYLNNANVWYSGGPGGTAANSSMSETIGTAPVSVVAPMKLTKKVDCVYTGSPSACLAYTSGPLPPGSKLRYRLDYTNTGTATLNGLVLTDTLPANTTFVTGTALLNGATSIIPTGTTVLTFPLNPTSLTGSAAGYVTFEVQLCTAVGTGCAAIVTSGTDITNTAKITASTFLAGVQASVTTSVRDQANLQITKTASPSIIQVGGTTTYTVKVTNNGNASASNIKIYDELPFIATPVSDTTQRFNLVGTVAFANSATNSVATNLLAPTMTAATPPTLTGYTVQLNQQELLWTFTPALVLAKGDSFTLTYTATAGANVPASATAYTSDVLSQFISATVPPSNTLQTSSTKTADVFIGGLDHLLISHNGQGLTCEPETTTVKACADTTCSTTFSGQVTATLNGSATATTFTGGTTSSSVSNTAVGNFTLTASSISPTPQNATPVSCTDGTNATCILKFVDAGLILSDATSIATALATTPSTTHGAEITIPSQVAGVASLPYLVRAVKTDKVTKACVSAVNGLTMPTTVDFAYECNDPTTCATGKLLSVSNGTTATTVQSNDNGSTYAYTGISLSFDANGNATTPITLSYEDVGQITLRMHMNVGTNNTGGANLFGNSNSFIVVPHHLLADVCGSGTTGDCTANTAAATSASTVLAVAGTVSTQTGTGFKASVRAMSANDNVTPSFGKAGCQPDLFGTCVGSNKTETVTLTGICTAPIVLPATTCLGGLHGTVSYFRNDATNGVLTTSSDLTWDEVGLMKLTVSNSTFMGIASGAKGTSADAGRFRPDHFDTAATGTLGCASPTPFATCPPGNMVYSAQNFAGATFTALNAAGSTTSNYQAAFAKTVTLSAVAAPGGAALASGALTAPNIVAGTFISGVATATVAAANFPLFTLADLNPLDVYLRALDADNVTSLRTIAASSVEGGVKVVAGRIKIGNAYGSEKLELAMPFTVQLFDGTQWRVSTTDSSTQMNTNKTVVGNISTAGLAVNVKAPATKTITSGNLVGFKLAAPNVAGKATVSVVNSAANNLDYLLTNMITGEATFGIYKGSNEFIYMREAY